MFEITADNFVVEKNQSQERPVANIDTSLSIFYLGFSLAVLQAMDGMLTAIGVSRYGHAVEGNPLLRSLMEEYGHGLTLGLSKTVAIFIVVFLTLIARKIPWVKKAIGVLTCIYFFGAILPWTYILFIYPAQGIL